MNAIFTYSAFGENHTPSSSKNFKKIQYLSVLGEYNDPLNAVLISKNIDRFSAKHYMQLSEQLQRQERTGNIIYDATEGGAVGFIGGPKSALVGATMGGINGYRRPIKPINLTPSDVIASSVYGDIDTNSGKFSARYHQALRDFNNVPWFQADIRSFARSQFSGFDNLTVEDQNAYLDDIKEVWADDYATSGYISEWQVQSMKKMGLNPKNKSDQELYSKRINEVTSEKKVTHETLEDYQNELEKNRPESIFSDSGSLPEIRDSWTLSKNNINSPHSEMLASKSLELILKQRELKNSTPSEAELIRSEIAELKREIKEATQNFKTEIELAIAENLAQQREFIIGEERAAENRLGSNKEHWDEFYRRNEASPVHIAGRQMYSVHNKNLKAISTALETFKIISDLGGGDVNVDRTIAAGNAALQIFDAMSVLRKRQSMNTIADATALFSGIGTIGAAVGILSNLGGIGKPDPMTLAIQQIIEMLDVILKNQKTLIEGQQIIIGNQISISYQLGLMRNAITQLSADNQQVTRTILNELFHMQKQLDSYHLFVTKKLRDIRRELQLGDLEDGIITYETGGSLGPKIIDKAFSKVATEFSNLTSSLPELRKPIVDDIILKNDNSLPNPAIKKHSESTPYPGSSMALLFERNIYEKNNQIREILENLCGDAADCEKFSDLPNAPELRMQISLFTRAAIIFAKQGKTDFLEVETRNLRKQLSTAAAELSNASIEAEKLEPKAREELLNNMLELKAILSSLSMSEVLAQIGSMKIDYDKESRIVIRDRLERELRTIASVVVPTAATSAFQDEKSHTNWGLDKLFASTRLRDDILRDLFYITGHKGVRELAAQHGFLASGPNPYLPLGKVWSQTNKKSNKGKGKWTLVSYLEIDGPVYIDKARASSFLGTRPELISAVFDVGTIKGIADYKQIKSGALLHRGTTLFQFVSELSDKWHKPLRGEVRNELGIVIRKAPEPQHNWRAFRGVGTLTIEKVLKSWGKDVTETIDNKLDDDLNKQPKLVWRDLEELDIFRGELLLSAAKKSRALIRENWDRVFLGLPTQTQELPNYGAILSKKERENPGPTKKGLHLFNNRLQNVYKKAPTIIARINENRLAYQTVLELGYGLRCLSSDPILFDAYNILESKIVPEGKELLQLTKQNESFYDLMRRIDFSIKLLEKPIDKPNCIKGPMESREMPKVMEFIDRWIADGAKPEKFSRERLRASIEQ